MKYVGFLLFFLSLNVHADNWLCTEESSQRVGSEINACGIGTGISEDEARTEAFNNSKAEFDRVCNASADCKNHEVTLTPMRTTCEVKNFVYTCQRLVVYSIGKDKSIMALNINIRPYTTAPIKVYGKIHEGMTRKEVTSMIGMPESVEKERLEDVVVTTYNGAICNKAPGGIFTAPCSLTFTDGKLTSYDNINAGLVEEVASN
jgi:hypothetical protein